MLVLLRDIKKLEIDNPDHIETMRTLNDAGLISYLNVATGIVFSVERMPRETALGVFELLAN